MTARQRLQLFNARYQHAVAAMMFTTCTENGRAGELAAASAELESIEAAADFEDAPEQPHPNAPEIGKKS